MVKKGFTLFELFIVIVISSIAFGFIAVKFDLISSSKNITLKTIKQHLLTYDFNESIFLKCTDEQRCFLYIDGDLQSIDIKLDIPQDIEVYKYNNNMERLGFKDIEIKELERYNVVFELTIDSDKKHKDMIVLNNNNLYIFNSIYKEPIILNSFSDLNDYFYELKNEVLNSAF